MAIRVALLIVCAAAFAVPPAGAKNCQVSDVDLSNQNPYYRPGAPVRTSIGTGHVLHGFVLTSVGCRPIAHAKIEVFEATPSGRYSTAPSWAGRATFYSHADGSYRFEGPVPGAYGGEGSHIHMRITAPGYEAASATYHLKGETSARLDIVLFKLP